MSLPYRVFKALGGPLPLTPPLPEGEGDLLSDISAFEAVDRPEVSRKYAARSSAKNALKYKRPSDSRSLSPGERVRVRGSAISNEVAVSSFQSTRPSPSPHPASPRGRGRLALRY